MRQPSIFWNSFPALPIVLYMIYGSSSNQSKLLMIDRTRLIFRKEVLLKLKRELS